MTDRLPQLDDLERDEIGLLDVLQVIAENLRLLILGPLLLGLIALGLGYLTPPTFTANTIFLPPQQQQSAAAAMLQSLGPLAGIVAGGGALNPAERYVAFLQSRSIRDAMIERFDLMNRFATKSGETARAALGGSTKITVLKNGLIMLEVTDTDPKFAAELANAHVEELTKLLGRLALTEAQQRRVFFEQQLQKSRKGLIGAETALKTTGVNESAIKASPPAAVGAVATLMAQVAAKEVEIGAMRGFLTEGAPDFQRAQTELRALRAQLAQIERGSGAISGGSDYVSKYRDFKYYEALYELMAKQYELARVDESREGSAVQVVDRALPPERKSGPKKALNAIITALITGFVLLVFVFLKEIMQNVERDPESAYKMSRLRQSLRSVVRKS